MSKLIKKLSQKQEKRTAKEFGGKTTPASGALSGAKGDVRTGERKGASFNQEDFLIENKLTSKNYYPLKLSIWEKIEKEALRDNFRIPLMQIDIQDYQVVIISMNDLQSLVDLRDFEIVEEIYTEGKSCRLQRDDLEDMLSHSNGVYLEFGADKVLVIINKAEFLDWLNL